MSISNVFWLLALIVWIGGSSWWHTCKIKLLCEEPALARAADQPAPELPALHIMDGAQLMLMAPGNFSFAASGAEPGIASIRSELDSVARYLLADPDRRMLLTGYYSASENNNTSWPDLGIARAENVKIYFVQQGVPPAVIQTSGERSEELLFTADSLRGGLELNFTTALGLAENALATSQKFETIFQSLDLYFNTGSVQYIQTPDNTQFIEEARKYLVEHPDKKLLLTGHTDNVGNAPSNLALSRDRAEEVRNQLVASGLPADQLTVAGKGQTQPKASNATEEGRAANRRVSLVVN